ncbi:helix-turn-helix domain-containing protein [Mycolicibacterium goodii]|uniref:helix-turn-helix domain-containing protein n=1 Tax=Mycolicibacterium goodii TaxID=134601 RepID=UPI00256F1405|nr:helix-turn-helix transcriptional regulator [Mycolicibacterium goodii]
MQAFRDTVAFAEQRGMPDLPGSDLGLDHLRHMLAVLEEESFTPAKLGRWLGWAQCALVAAGVGVTLDDMKALNASHLDDPPGLATDGKLLEANSAMVRLHRVALGWPKKRLADEAGWSAPHVSRVEAGTLPLTGTALPDYARALGCSVEALCASFTPSPAVGVRPRSSSAEWKRDQAWARANLAALRIGRLADHVDLDPALSLPQLDPAEYANEGTGGAVTAAQVLRRLWRIAGPIRSIVELLEAAGVFVVIDNEFCGHEVETVILRTAADHPALIYADGTLPEDRLRMALAAALGQLVMMDSAATSAGSRAGEQHAAAFAAEFLAPIDDIGSDLARVSLRTMHELDELRARWGVSAASLIDRARDHGILSDYQRRSLYRLLNETGRISGASRLDIPEEQPTLVDSVLAQLAAAGYTRPELDAITLCPREDRDRIFGRKRRALAAVAT